jgi:hypothetical protein
MDLFQRFALGDIDAFETLVRQFQGDITHGLCASCVTQASRRI